MFPVPSWTTGIMSSSFARSCLNTRRPSQPFRGLPITRRCSPAPAQTTCWSFGTWPSRKRWRGWITRRVFSPIHKHNWKGTSTLQITTPWSAILCEASWVYGYTIFFQLAILALEQVTFQHWYSWLHWHRSDLHELKKYTDKTIYFLNQMVSLVKQHWNIFKCFCLDG